MTGTALQNFYVFSYMRRGKSIKTEIAGAPENAVSAEPHPYENSIKTIASVSTVEEFWATYDFLKRPNDLPTTTDYHFFRDGIKPTWEDPGNIKGGKWIIRLPKGLSSRYWEEIILALIGCQFTGVPTTELCGAVLSVRYSEDILGIWNRSSSDRDLVDKIRDSIKKVLQLPANAHLEYKPHQASLADRSSFRNTQVWKPKNETRRSGSWGEQEVSGGKPVTERGIGASSGPAVGGKREVRGFWRSVNQ